MAQQLIPGGRLWFPGINANNYFPSSTTGFSFVNSATVDAVGEMIAFIGYVNHESRGTGKVISSAGGSLDFLTGTVVWAGTTTIRVGLQDVVTASGPAARPDETFDVFDDLVRGTDSLSTGIMKNVLMSSGSKTLNHGDLVAFVISMTARSGSDAVNTRGLQHNGMQFPGTYTKLSGAWGTVGITAAPICRINFDDGTTATLDGTIPVSVVNDFAWSDGGPTDEYGIIFQVPFPCTVDCARLQYRSSASTGDGTATLYSSPLSGSPVSMATASILGEHTASTAADRQSLLVFAPQTLAANTDYCFAVKATGAGNIIMPQLVFDNTNYRKLIPGGINVRGGFRNNGAGAFTQETVNYYLIDIGMTGFADDAGGGGASMKTHPGMSGGMRG